MGSKPEHVFLSKRESIEMVHSQVDYELIRLDSGYDKV